MLLELFFSAITVDYEDLELGCVRVFVGLLNEVSERLQETLARRAVLRGEKHDDMRGGGPDQSVLNRHLFIRVERLRLFRGVIRISNFFLLLFLYLNLSGL